MKISQNIVRHTAPSAIVAMLALAAFSNPATALAQAKGGELLMNRPRAASVVQPKGTDRQSTAMACEKCTDKWVKVAQPAGKGGRQEVATVQQHQCPTCRTTLETQGSGKQAITTAKHVCKESKEQASNCCASKSADAKAKSN